MTRPNILLVVLDDVGFGQLGCYGSSIETPAIDDLAGTGLRYSAFHTTGICSSTRACLLTGRNHHAVGIGTVIDFCDGRSPGYTGVMDPSVPTIAERLRSEAGYSTFCVGKWHLCSRDEQRREGPYSTWPLARGFDRFYGFLGGATSQWHPDLMEDNHPRRPPARPEDGYHLSSDLVDQAITMIRRQRKQIAPGAFFTYLSFGCGHEPHHVGPEWIERYRGRFDHGWDVERDRIFERQKQMGIVAGDAVLPPRNPGVPAWSTLNDDERLVFARLQEVYAGFLTHCDAQIGRLVQWLKDRDLYADTLLIVLSDNGASPEGGATGFAGTTSPYRVGRILMNESGGDPVDRVVSSMRFDDHGNHIHQPERVEDMLTVLDRLGQPDAYNHYPQGWAQAGNTPFRRYKHSVHYGGTRDPLVVNWPDRIGDAGAVRAAFCHAVDIGPTCLAAAGLRIGETDGEDLAPTFDAPTFDVDRRSTRTQYFEMTGHRGIQHGRFKAVAFHHRRCRFEDDAWELFDTEADPTEVHDLAAAEPEKLAELRARWLAEAERNQVLPLQDIPVIDIRFRPGSACFFDFARTEAITGPSRPDLAAGPVMIRIDLRHHDGAQGALFVDSSPRATQSAHVAGDRVVYRSVDRGILHEMRSDTLMSDGDHRIEVRLGFGGDGVAELFVDGRPVARSASLARVSAPDATLSIGADPNAATPTRDGYSGSITGFVVRTVAGGLSLASDDVAAVAFREQ